MIVLIKIGWYFEQFYLKKIFLRKVVIYLVIYFWFLGEVSRGICLYKIEVLRKGRDEVIVLVNRYIKELIFSDMVII